MQQAQKQPKQSKCFTPLWHTWEELAKRQGERRTIYSPEGGYYQGSWENDRKDGFGVRMWPNGMKYEGHWNNGQRSGHGTLFIPCDSASDRNMKKDRGTISQPTEFVKVYEGEWKEDKMDGRGKRWYSDGSIYDGEWRNGKRHGQGRLLWPNGDIYDGSWEEDHRNGFGKLTYANGNEFRGQWVIDKKHGPGTFYYASAQQIYEGEWIEDVAKCGQLYSLPSAPKQMPELGLVEPDKVLEKQVQAARTGSKARPA